TNVYVNGKLFSTIDAAGGQTSYGYLFGGLLASISQVGDIDETVTTTFGYTANLLTQTTGPDQQPRYFVYDKLGNQTLSYS
ncbi:hypothetical protein, partial [Salmonella sp. SAL4433]|uniref:hypothetical protein n=1 Tax=Salmonella sp. SAL4433 TaxID=3159888 RepID=UPI00397E0A6F